MDLNDADGLFVSNAASGDSIPGTRIDACDPVWDALCRFVDGELSCDESAELSQHLKSCAACTRDLVWLRASTGALANTPQANPPIWLHEKIMRATVEKPSAWDRILEVVRPLLRPIPAMSAMAAAGIAVVFFFRDTTIPFQSSPSNSEHTTVAKSPISVGDIQLNSPRNFEHEEAPKIQVTSPHGSIVMNSRLELGGRRINPAKLLTSNRPSLTSLVIDSKKSVNRIAANKIAAASETKPESRDVATDMLDVPVSSDPMLMEPMNMPMPVVKAANPNEVVAATTPEPAPTAPVRIRLVSSSPGELTGHGMTLATLKQELRSRNLDNERTIAESIRSRQLRLSLFKGSF